MIGFILILLYILYIIVNYGVPKSISASYYLIKYKWMFSLIILISTILSFEQFMIITPDDFKFLPFIFCSGILFVAASPNFSTNSIIGKVHDYSAIISFAASQIWVAIINPLSLLFWIFILLYIINLYKEYKSVSLILNNTCIKFWTELVMLFIIFSQIISF